MSTLKPPKVTVYLTNFNYSRYIETAIESVLGQTFRDFEFFIFDDGSTDNSMDVIRKYEDEKNVYIVSQKNVGLNVTNNIALKMAQGNSIIRLDADDYLDPRALEVMVSTIESESEIALVFPDYYEVDESGKIIRQVRRHNFENDVSLRDQPAHGACTLIRTDILKEVGGYDENFRKQDGYDIWLKVHDRVRIININLPLFYYRKHPGSLSDDEVSLLETRKKIKEKRVLEKNIKPISVLAILPVRGSNLDPRSLPLSSLGNRNLIDWTIEPALKSDLIDTVLVSTPDPAVADYINDQYGGRVLVYSRPNEDSYINIDGRNTLKNATIYFESLRGIGGRIDAIMALNIDYPFKKTMHIDKALHTFQLFDVSIVQSVIPDDEFYYVHEGRGLKPRIESDVRLERDYLYRQAGGISLYERSVLFESSISLSWMERNFTTGHILLDQKTAFGIRTELDWTIAEAIARSNSEDQARAIRNET